MSAYARRTGRRRRALAVTAPALAVAVVLLTACGDGSDGAAAKGQDNGQGQNGQATQAYRDCLRANGVTLPSGNPGGGGRPSGMPSGGPGGPGGMPGDGTRTTDVPSMPAGDRPTARPSGAPDGNGDGRGGGGMPGPRSTDPAYAKAEEACASLRPQRDNAGRPSGAASSAAPTATAPAADPDSATAAFAGCLKDRQVELPTGGVEALDRTNAQVAEALTVCGPLLPAPAG
jgi:hypothetical protein